MPPHSAMCRTLHEMLIGTHLLSFSALAICTKPLARQGMPLWHLVRVLDTEGGVHDTSNASACRRISGCATSPNARFATTPTPLPSSQNTSTSHPINSVPSMFAPSCYICSTSGSLPGNHSGSPVGAVRVQRSGSSNQGSQNSYLTPVENPLP
jgi:hypothetical protein